MDKETQELILKHRLALAKINIGTGKE